MSEFDGYSLEYHEGAPSGERLHAILGASSSERWMNCPRSVALSKGMPNRSSMFAMEGTAAHNLGELCLRENLSADAFYGKLMTYSGHVLDDTPKLDPSRPTVIYEGNTYDEEDPAFEINEDMRNAVNVYLHAIEDRQTAARKKYKEEPQLLIETMFDLSGVYPGMFGSNDAALFIPGVYLDVGDYKHGRGKVVKIQNNSQIKYYGLGALRKLCKDEFEEPETIDTFIVQPRAYHKDGPVRTASYSNSQITLDFRRELVAAAKETEREDAALKAGDWCFFCPGKTRCPLMTQKIHDAAAASMLDLSEEELGLVPVSPPKVVAASEHVAHAVRTITSDPEAIGAYLRFLPVLHAVEKEVKLIATEMMKNKVMIPGQDLVYGDKHRIWDDESLLVEDMRKAGFEHNQIYETKVKSPSQMEKLGKAAKSIIDKHAVKPQGEITIADESDKRQKVNPVIVQESFDLL